MKWRRAFHGFFRRQPLFELNFFEPFSQPISTSRLPVVCPVEASFLRGLEPLSFNCSLADAHPYIRTLRDRVVHRHDAYIGSAMELFYKLWTPQNAAELLGMSNSNAGAALRASPPTVRVWPWSNLTPGEMVRLRSERLRRNGVREDPGGQFHGPKPTEAGCRNFARLVEVFESIKGGGYRRTSKDDGDIEGILLRRGDDAAVLVRRGQHRMAALAALDHRTALIRLINPSSPIDRAGVADWPNVTNGLFSEDQALTVFDRIFEGRQPPNFPQGPWLAFRVAASDFIEERLR